MDWKSAKGSQDADVARLSVLRDQLRRHLDKYRSVPDWEMIPDPDAARTVLAEICTLTLRLRGHRDPIQ